MLVFVEGLLYCVLPPALLGLVHVLKDAQVDAVDGQLVPLLIETLLHVLEVLCVKNY